MDRVIRSISRRSGLLSIRRLADGAPKSSVITLAQRFIKKIPVMLLMAIVSLGHYGCISSRGQSLESAVNSLYLAEQTCDWKSKWKLLYHDTKKEMTEAQFIQEQTAETNEFRILSWKIIKMEPLAVPEEGRKSGVQSAMKIPMDVYRQSESHKTPEKVKDLTDYWMNINGQWYLYWRGFPID